MMVDIDQIGLTFLVNLASYILLISFSYWLKMWFMWKIMPRPKIRINVDATESLHFHPSTSSFLRRWRVDAWLRTSHHIIILNHSRRKVSHLLHRTWNSTILHSVVLEALVSFAFGLYWRVVSWFCWLTLTLYNLFKSFIIENSYFGSLSLLLLNLDLYEFFLFFWCLGSSSFSITSSISFLSS